MSNALRSGWNMPPGCFHVPGDEDYPCEICGNSVDDCVCPECPKCSEYGNPKCYSGKKPHLILNAEQVKEANIHIDEMFKERDAENAFAEELSLADS